MQGRVENEMRILRASDELMNVMPDFANEWYMNLKSSGKTASSCYDFMRKIRNFLEYISDDIKNFDPCGITLQACESFMIASQTTKGRDGMEKETTLSHQYSVWCSLNSFLTFLVDRNYIDYNYMNDIKRPNTYNAPKEKAERVLLTQKDFRKILDAAKTGNKEEVLNNRDVLIILLFMTTGLSKTAMTNLDVDDLDLENGTLTVTENKNKTQVYQLDDQVIELLNKWLEDRETLLNGSSCEALFLRRNGTRLGDDSIYNIVRNSCKKGIGKMLSPNKLRASFCAILYNKTKDIEFVRKVVGHKTVNSTRRYIKKDVDDTKKASKIMCNLLKI